MNGIFLKEVRLSLIVLRCALLCSVVAWCDVHGVARRGVEGLWCVVLAIFCLVFCVVKCCVMLHYSFALGLAALM